jgi:hypothetical protein
MVSDVFEERILNISHKVALHARQLLSAFDRKRRAFSKGSLHKFALCMLRTAAIWYLQPGVRDFRCFITRIKLDLSRRPFINRTWRLIGSKTRVHVKPLHCQLSAYPFDISLARWLDTPHHSMDGRSIVGTTLVANDESIVDR